MIRARIRVDGSLAAVCWRFWGAPMAAYSGCGERDGGIRTASGARGPGWRELAETFSWPAGGSAADGAPSGWEWQGPQSGQGANELGFPGPVLCQMQGESAGRAGEPSGEGGEASS